ncbi:MAG: Zn-dependent alcohol dehydrogenase [Sphingomonadaceae bacterium]|nr:Zn-dependent alcohol dehydrogenase [Sphingomonadaceae bacterium]
MKAAVLREIQQPLTIEDVELDAPRPDEVRIRVVGSGLCHSDYHSISGDLLTPMPAVLGHEAAGVVEAVGSDVSEFKPGDEVVSCTSMYCGHCRDCQTGHNNVCGNNPKSRAEDLPSRITRGKEAISQFAGLGGFAEEMLIHRTGLTKIPEGMPLDRAALLGCAVLTGVGAALNRGAVSPGSTVVVIGCGGVGLNVIQGARLAGAARIIAVDLNERKFDLARTFGATDCVKGGPDAVAEVREMTGGGADYSFEVIGLPSTQEQALMMLRRRGVFTVVGMAPSGSSFSVPGVMVMAMELEVRGSLMGSAPFQQAIPNYAQLYLNGKLKLDELVSQRIKLEDINDGYDNMIAGDVARSVIVFDN